MAKSPLSPEALAEIEAKRQQLEQLRRRETELRERIQHEKEAQVALRKRKDEESERRKEIEAEFQQKDAELRRLKSALFKKQLDSTFDHEHVQDRSHEITETLRQVQRTEEELEALKAEEFFARRRVQTGDTDPAHLPAGPSATGRDTELEALEGALAAKRRALADRQRALETREQELMSQRESTLRNWDDVRKAHEDELMRKREELRQKQEELRARRETEEQRILELREQIRRSKESDTGLGPDPGLSTGSGPDHEPEPAAVAVAVPASASYGTRATVPVASRASQEFAPEPPMPAPARAVRAEPRRSDTGAEPELPVRRIRLGAPEIPGPAAPEPVPASVPASGQDAESGAWLSRRARLEQAREERLKQRKSRGRDVFAEILAENMALKKGE